MTPAARSRDIERGDPSGDERRTDVLLLLAVLAGIGAVAYADKLVVTISLGYLYVLPLSLAALVLPLPASFALVAICVVLHDWLGPFVHSGWQMLSRNLLTLFGFTTVVLFVHALAEQRRRLSRQVRVRLEPGDVVVLYTDGVVEAQNPDGELYSTERLSSAASANRGMAAQELVSAIYRSVVAFASSMELQDDLTLMVLKVAPGPVCQTEP
jgi:hypothetical protein